MKIFPPNPRISKNAFVVRSRRVLYFSVSQSIRVALYFAIAWGLGMRLVDGVIIAVMIGVIIFFAVRPPAGHLLGIDGEYIFGPARFMGGLRFPTKQLRSVRLRAGQTVTLDFGAGRKTCFNRLLFRQKELRQFFGRIGISELEYGEYLV